MSEVKEKTVGSGKVGFGADIPGMRTAPVEHIVKAKTREAMSKQPEAWKAYNDLSRTMRIVNRAEKGPMAGKAFAHKFDGQMWPDGADVYDQETWLQPGEYMDVPKDVALHICGNLWDPALPSKMDIIQRYGDWEYKPQPNGVGRMAPMVKAGPPSIPDLAVCELDGRSKPKSEYKMVYELYMRGEKFGDDITGELTALTSEPYERVKG